MAEMRHSMNYENEILSRESKINRLHRAQNKALLIFLGSTPLFILIGMAISYIDYQDSKFTISLNGTEGVLIQFFIVSILSIVLALMMFLIAIVIIDKMEMPLKSELNELIKKRNIYDHKINNCKKVTIYGSSYIKDPINGKGNKNVYLWLNDGKIFHVTSLISMDNYTSIDLSHVIDIQLYDNRVIKETTSTVYTNDPYVQALALITGGPKRTTKKEYGTDFMALYMDDGEVHFFSPNLYDVLLEMVEEK